MLGNAMRKYVMSGNKSGYSKEVQSVYNSRIKKYAKQAIQDLALLAQELPDDQQSEIFNNQTIGPLFRALIKPTPEKMNRLINDKNAARKKRQTLLPICNSLISHINDHYLAHLLAPVGTRYMIKEGGQLVFLKAIYYRSLSSDDEE